MLTFGMDEAVAYLAGALNEPQKTAEAILRDLGYVENVPGEVLGQVISCWVLLDEAWSATEH